jgi:putative membrane-bound dehydrogenase-like protein
MCLTYTRLPWAVIAACLFIAPYISFAQEPAADEDSADRDYSAELPRIAPTEPEDALATFEVKPGFRMELVAAEPLVRDPIAMSFDEQGRLFIVEMRGYSEERDENIGEIRMLEDVDGDGIYDKASTYLGGLAWPTAVACYDGGVFVGVAPDILYCKDTDGDGLADVKEVVYTGFNLTNVQGLLNTFLWGLDSRLHGATSSSGAEVRPASDLARLPISLRGRDFSFDPRTRDFRPESGGAQHGMSFNDWGRKFVCSNSDHLQLVMFDDAYINRNPYLAAPGPRISIAVDGPSADVFRISPVEPWRIVRTRLRVKGLVPGPIEGGGTAAGYFTSATGVTIYRGDAWPEDYRGNAFIADVGSNLIHRKVLSPKGVELTAQRAEGEEKVEFVASTDIWFRPVQFANGPDGALYVADMYREIIEHPDSLPPVIKKHLDLTSGRDRGRIYRIVPEDFVPREIPNLGSAPSSDLVALLEHPNAWHRETAARLLYERQAKEIAPNIQALVAESKSPIGRIQAMYTLAGLDQLDPEVLSTGLNDPDHYVREHAARLSEPYLEDNEGLRKQVIALASDPKLRVRYQVAFSLGACRGNDRNRALVEIAREQSDDRWFRLAILSSSVYGSGEIFAALASDAEYRVTDAGRAFLEDLALQVGATALKSDLTVALDRIDALPVEEDALAQNAVRGLIQGMKQAGKGGEAQAVLATSERAEALLAQLLDSAHQVAGDVEREVPKRVDAIQTLGFDSFDNTRDVLFSLLDQRQPADVQRAALATLRKFDSIEIAGAILDAWSGMTPALRAQAIEALFSREPWLVTMLDAIGDGSFRAANLDSLRVRSLLAYENADIKARAERVLADYNLGSRQEIVDAYQDVLTMKGDPERGKAVFTENCSKCHKVQGVGFEVGPDLSTVTQAGPDKILVNVLDPNREVNPQYVNYTIETNGWESHSGIIASETATSITLKRADGESDTVLRVNIDDIKSDNLSIMPEGWEQTIGKEDLANLIAYLTSLD